MDLQAVLVRQGLGLGRRVRAELAAEAELQDVVFHPPQSGVIAMLLEALRADGLGKLQQRVQILAPLLAQTRQQGIADFPVVCAARRGRVLAQIAHGAARLLLVGGDVPPVMAAGVEEIEIHLSVFGQGLQDLQLRRGQGGKTDDGHPRRQASQWMGAALQLLQQGLAQGGPVLFALLPQAL